MNYQLSLDNSKSFQSARHTDVNCGKHLHSSLEVIIVTEGVLNMEIGGNEYTIPAGLAAFVPQYTTHTFRSVQHNKAHVIMFTKSIAPYFTDFLKLHRPKNHIFKLSAEIMSIVEQLLPHEINNPNIFKAKAVSSLLINEIYDSCDFYRTTDSNFDTLFTAIVYMEAHFNEHITLESVAEKVGIHPVTLSRGFSSKATLSFSSYLNYLRCISAAETIKSENKTFAEISYQVGFGSIRSFNRAFRELYGVTPTEYRKSFQGSADM